MSIALMTLAWKSAAPAGQKMVLLALCDNANDQGECYPSISMLARKCSMAERTVQNHIADMEEAGIVVRAYRAGRSTVYHIDPRKFCTPADSAPQQNPHPAPAKTAPQPPQDVHPAPAKSAPITTNEPPKEPSGKPSKRGKAANASFDPMAALLAVGVSEKAARDWLQVRKAKRAPLTETALDGIKTEAAHAGLSMQETVVLCVEKNWQGFFASWVEPKSAPGHGSGKFNPTAHVNRNRHGGAA
jgi:hypothetical protein